MSDESELEKVRRLIEQGRIGQARTRALTAIENPIDDDHLRPWADVFEQLGLGAHANGLWRRLARRPDASVTTIRHALDVLDDDGRSAGADELLTEILSRRPGERELVALEVTRLRARGRYAEARDLAEKSGIVIEGSALGVGESDTTVGEEEPLLPSDPDLLRFMDLFSGRENVHARQWCDGHGKTGYSPVRAPIDFALVRNHILGNVSLGVYLLHLDARVSFFVIDLDIRRELLQTVSAHPENLVDLRRALDETTAFWRDRMAGMGFDPLLEDSGHRGRHIWVFLERPLPARIVLDFGKKLLRHLAGSKGHGGISVEFFPKQARLGPRGLGNLVKLPLGIHRASGRRSRLLAADGRPLLDPWPALRSVGKADEETVLEARRRVQRTPLVDVETEPECERTHDLGRPPGATRIVSALGGAPWTEQHFRADPQLAAVLQGCHLLRRVVEEAWKSGQGAYPRQLVIRHTLGHLPQAVAGVNAVFRRLPAVPDHHWLNGPLGGPIMSCAAIRKRLRCEPLECPCEFGDPSHSYPHPLLHAVGTPGPDFDAEESELRHAAEAWRLMEEEGRSDPDERAALAKFLDESLENRSDGTVPCRGGVLRRVVQEGVATLVFEPSESQPAVSENVEGGPES